MDKETLSNYGWIVICVLVLAVMIALASPFGSYIASAVENTTQGLFDVQQGALSAAGIDIADQSFEGGSDTTTPDPALNPNDGTTPQIGDTYTYGDYEYCYGYGWCSLDNVWSNVCICSYTTNGWGVHILDDTKTEYGAILESINGQPITGMIYTFKNCTNLITAPTIPSSVTDMSETFRNCTSLTTAPAIPDNVKYIPMIFRDCTSLETAPTIPSGVIEMYQTFDGCTSLTTAPVIPSSVTDMDSTFAGCTALETAPVIPSSVKHMSATFDGCTSLTGNIEINANPTNYGSCLRGTQITSISGSCDEAVKQAILATK